jgi:hypothetical protein
MAPPCYVVGIKCNAAIVLRLVSGRIDIKMGNRHGLSESVVSYACGAFKIVAMVLQRGGVRRIADPG